MESEKKQKSFWPLDKEPIKELKNFLWCEPQLFRWNYHVMPPDPAAYPWMLDLGLPAVGSPA